MIFCTISLNSFLSFCIFISQFIQILSSSCILYSTCIECILSNCDWNTQNNNCISLVSKGPGILSHLTSCEDIETTTDFCENTETNSIPFKAQIKSNVNTPLDNNYIFCKWEINEISANKVIILNFNKQDDLSSNTFFNLELHYKDKTIATQSLKNKDNHYEYEIKDVNKIIFIYYVHSLSSFEFESSPFEIEFSYQSKKKTNITLIITLSIGIFIFVILAIAIIVFLIMKYKNKEKLTVEDMPRRRRHFTRRNTRHLINSKHLHDLFLKLNILKYDNSLNEFGNICTICLEQFKPKVSVVKGICGHIFHEQCLKELLYKDMDKDEHKCPNCNGNLVEEDSYDKSRANKKRLTAILMLRNPQQMNINETENMQTPSLKKPIRCHSLSDNTINSKNEMIHHLSNGPSKNAISP